MPLPTFMIPKPAKDAAREEQQAWSYMQQQLELKHFVPVVTDFTGTVPTTNVGYFQLLGPVVFFMLHLKSTDVFGWDIGATITIPHAAFTPTNFVLFPQFANPVVDVTTGLAINDECPAIGAGILTLNTALSYVGGPTEVVIRGFYLRNGVSRYQPVGG
jgi:hypothetical protein